jgi:hypothetical protein
VPYTAQFDCYKLTWSQIVPKSSAIVPGALNAEAIGLYKNHMDIIRFSSVKDDDFNVVVSLLQSMGSDYSELEPNYGRNCSQTEGIADTLIVQLHIFSLAPSDTLNKGQCYKCKLQSSPRFTGQNIYLEKLRTFFAHDDITTSPKHLLIHGMGGIGKTQICLKFAEQSAEEKLWVKSYYICPS